MPPIAGSMTARPTASSSTFVSCSTWARVLNRRYRSAAAAGSIGEVCSGSRT
jgi:hypothetical protein